MKHFNGFSLPEVLIAMSIIMMLVATALPIHQLITTEQYRMEQHQLMKLALHDELEKVLWAHAPLTSLHRKVNRREVKMSFKKEDEYVKGCATWKNVREKTEKVCLYGLQEQ